MADYCLSCITNAPQKLKNQTKDRGYTCLNCAELERQLEETRKELSSSQLITELLYKVISESNTERPSRPTSTIPECEPGVEATSTNRWSTIASKRQYNGNKTRSSGNHCKQPLETTNSYTMLHNLLVTPNYKEGNETTGRIEVTTSSTNNYNKAMN